MRSVCFVSHSSIAFLVDLTFVLWWHWFGIRKSILSLSLSLLGGSAFIEQCHLHDLGSFSTVLPYLVSVICNAGKQWRKASKLCVYRVSFIHNVIFTMLQVMQTRYSEENSVCLSVCPSVCPSVRLSHAWSLTKWKRDLSRFLHHTKEYLS